MLIGAVSLGWAGQPLPQVFEQARSMGGEYLELNSRPALHDGLILSADNISQARARAKAAGIRIGGVSGYNDFAQTDPAALQVEVQGLLSACHLAAELGATVVRAFAGEPKPGLSLDDVWPALVDGLQQAAQLAEPLGVTLGVENHGLLLNDGPTLARLIEEVGAPNVGVTLDTGNFCWVGHSRAQAHADVKAVLPYVVNVHIKDGIWRAGLFELVPAGMGELPLVEWLDTLVEFGYRGPVCSEFEGAGDFLEGTRRSIQHLLSWRNSRKPTD